MYHFIYKTTNTINGKYYIGAHQTTNIDDGYLGSGKKLCKDIVKYGKQKFSRIILKECTDPQEMYISENRIIGDLWKTDALCYNVRPGGKGGFNHIDNRGENNPMKNPQTAQRCADALKKTILENREKYIDGWRKNLEKATKGNIGKKRPQHSDFMTRWAAQNWKDNREKMRDTMSSYFLVTDPKGNQTITNRLEDFCEENNIPYTSVWKTSSRKEPLTKGKAKGWKCEIYTGR